MVQIRPTSRHVKRIHGPGKGNYGGDGSNEEAQEDKREIEGRGEQREERGSRIIPDHVRGHLSSEGRPYQRESCGQRRCSNDNASSSTDIVPYRLTRRSSSVHPGHGQLHMYSIVEESAVCEHTEGESSKGAGCL